MKILGIVNPISGGNSKKAFIDYFKSTTHMYGIEAEILETTGEDDLSKIKLALASKKPDMVVAIGGDGTFALVSIAAAGTEVNVGVIPLGSANGMAKELGVNQTPERAFDDLLKSRLVKPLDLIDINGAIDCMHLADIGLNAKVVQGFDTDPNRGMLTYGKYLAKELQNLSPIKYKLEANGEEITGECGMIIIANGRKYGTGVSITEAGNPFDGLFELVIVEDINISTILKAGLSIIDQFHDTANRTDKVISTSQAKITFEKPQLLQVDGEVIGKFDKLDINIRTKQVNYLTTSSNLYIANK